jgi:hypothetical protein
MRFLVNFAPFAPFPQGAKQNEAYLEFDAIRIK